MTYLILFFVGFLLVHLAKMTRLYLVLMEHKIPFGKFVLLYLKTTLVNLIIPFKLGEIYRFFCISRETKRWQVGVLSIIVDRFFDTLALCLILIPCDIAIVRQVSDSLLSAGITYSIPFYSVLSDMTLVFLLILSVIAICYAWILPTYRYLNRYLIKEKSSARSLAALKGLDVVKEWYDFTQNLISGRFALILLSSFAGWIFEIMTLGFLAKYFGKAFHVVEFQGYIHAIFGVGSSELIKPYTIYSVVIVAACTVVAFICWIIQVLKAKKAHS